MEGFNLYREARNDYERLVPDKLQGLVLLSLYSKFGESDFEENDIILAIESVYKDINGIAPERTEYVRNNRVIIDFQNSFLWRDKIAQRYRFRTYGLKFFQAISERLESSYNPAKIKRQFDELTSSLKKSVDEDIKEGFALWVEEHFEYRKTTLSQQVESLDEQVSRSVEDFKTCIKRSPDNIDIISALREIEKGLDEIKSQAIEMKLAFETTFEIDDFLTNMLRESLENDYQIESRENISRVHDFNRNIRAGLEHVSDRIEKITPRIREFYLGFNRPDFERKSAKFLTFLLNHSVTAQDGSRKYLSPPEGIPLVHVTDTEIYPQFIVVPHRAIEVKSPIKASRKVVDKYKRVEFIKKTNELLHDKRRVKYWVNIAMERIDANGSLDFSVFFFEILKNERKKLSIAIKASQQILKKVRAKPELEVAVEQSRIKDKEIKSIEVWKVKIYQK